MNENAILKKVLEEIERKDIEIKITIKARMAMYDDGEPLDTADYDRGYIHALDDIKCFIEEQMK